MYCYASSRSNFLSCKRVLSQKKLAQQEKTQGIYVPFLILVTTVTTDDDVLFSSWRTFWEGANV